MISHLMRQASFVLICATALMLVVLVLLWVLVNTACYRFH